MAARLRKLSTCAVCRHPERQRIEALRASGASLDSLARKFKVHRDAIWRHWKDHVSADLKTSYLAGPATIAELKERAALEGGSILDHLSILRSILMGAITASAEAQSAFTLAALTGRLVEVLKAIGACTGEIERLNPGINVTTNIAIMSDPRMIELQSGLLQIARAHPAARADIVALLRDLDAKPQGLAGGLSAPAAAEKIAAMPETGANGLARPAGAPMIECEAIDAA
jgi:hypothetical protein